MRHAEEPWELTPDAQIAAIRTVAEYREMLKDGSRPKKNSRPRHDIICYFGILGSTWDMLDRYCRADARRIVACVNACAGIPDEALARGVVAKPAREERPMSPNPNEIHITESDPIDVKMLAQGPGAGGEPEARLMLGPIAVIAVPAVLKVIRDVIDKLLARA